MTKKFDSIENINKFIARGKDSLIFINIKSKMATVNDMVPKYWLKFKSTPVYGSFQDILRQFDVQRSIDYTKCPCDEKEKPAKKSGKPAEFLGNIMDKIKNCDIKKCLSGLKNMQSGGSGGRPMKFPYTFSAKIAQFPLKFYIQNQWVWRYYAISLAVCFPVFYYFNGLANSPGNVAKWAEIRRKEAAEHHH